MASPISSFGSSYPNQTRVTASSSEVPPPTPTDPPPPGRDLADFIRQIGGRAWGQSHKRQ